MRAQNNNGLLRRIILYGTAKQYSAKIRTTFYLNNILNFRNNNSI